MRCLFRPFFRNCASKSRPPMRPETRIAESVAQKAERKDGVSIRREKALGVNIIDSVTNPPAMKASRLCRRIVVKRLELYRPHTLKMKCHPRSMQPNITKFHRRTFTENT